MLITKKKGSAAVEFVCSTLFLFLFAGFVRQFAVLGTESHRISVDLQNRVENHMITQERPPCSKYGQYSFLKASNKKIFGEKLIYKKLIFFDDSICGVINE